MRYMFLAIAISLGIVWGATRYAAAQGEEDGRAAAAAELVAGVAPAPAIAADPPPPVSNDSAPEEVAAAAWWALRAGYLGPAVLFALFAGGMYTRQRRGWIIKRWPKLDDGRAWAVLSIVVMAIGTLIPLAAKNALTRDAVYAALVAAVFLYLMPNGKPASSAG